MTDNSEFLTKIKNLADPIAHREGCEIYDIEWISGSQGKGRVLRVYIEKQGGVGIDECTNVSRGLNLLLDVDDAIPGSGYSLEVSSPGLERTLRESRHFSAAIGSLIQVKLKDTKENLRFFQGKLLSFSDPELVVELDNQKQISVRVDEIHKARTIFKVVKNHPKGGRKSKR